jgi:hypothetical protein
VANKLHIPKCLTFVPSCQFLTLFRVKLCWIGALAARLEEFLKRRLALFQK